MNGPLLKLKQFLSSGDLLNINFWWKIQTFYLVNDPEKPVWLFRFFSRMNEFYDVTVDAHSREILMQKGEI